MRVASLIKAFFNFCGQRTQMEVRSARISRGVARIRSAVDGKVYKIQSKDITILIDNDDQAVEEVQNSEVDRTPDEPQLANEKEEKKTHSRRKLALDRNRVDYVTEKRSFSTGFYDAEREEIVAAYKTAKAKRDEYLLACVRVASARRVEAELRRIRRERDYIRGQNGQES